MSTSPEGEFVSSPEISAPRTRTSKGKSRSGCISCKQRRVKCDEVRPACTGCTRRSNQCVYKFQAEPQWKQNISTFITVSQRYTRTEAPASLVVKKTTSAVSSTNSYVSPALPHYHLSLISTEDCQSFGIEDGYLLNHFKSKSSLGLFGSQELWAGDILQLAFQNDFLLHGILTIAARHLHMNCRERTPEVLYDLKQLQEKHLQATISKFHSALKMANTGNNDALLATSFLLCFYACSTQDFKPSMLVSSEDTSFIFLLGTRSLLVDKERLAYNSLMKPLTLRPKWLSLFLPRISPILGPGGRLINLVNKLPITPTLLKNKEMYIERIESLTVYFSTLTTHDPDPQSVEDLSTCFIRWQAACPPSFVLLIKAYDPIALIILAHFYAAAGFVQMKADNLWWWWQDKPKYMVETIAEFLLPGWAEWLEWPVEMISRF